MRKWNLCRNTLAPLCLPALFPLWHVPPVVIPHSFRGKGIDTSIRLFPSSFIASCVNWSMPKVNTTTYSLDYAFTPKTCQCDDVDYVRKANSHTSWYVSKATPMTKSSHVFYFFTTSRFNPVQSTPMITVRKKKIVIHPGNGMISKENFV